MNDHETDAEITRRAEIEHAPDRSRKTAVALIVVSLLAILALSRCDRAKAQTFQTQPTCQPPTQYTNDQPLTERIIGYRWYYGASLGALVFIKQTTNCTALIENLTAGPWYIAVTAVSETSVESPKASQLRTFGTVTPPPPVLTLKVIDPAVYNTGTFSTTAWLVRRNKLYGTIPLGALCDATKPAADGYYRVPGTAVRWTNSLAKTPYPLAKCALQ